MSKGFLVKAGSIVGGGGLIFGYDIGVISTTITAMKGTISMTTLEEGWVVGIIGAGSVVGALIGGPLCDDIGRWKTIQLQNALFCIGSLTTASATDVYTLCLGRFIVGLASAVSAIADVPYLMEISPPKYRGEMGSVYEVMISFGVLISFLCGYFLAREEGGWRVAFALPCLLAVVQSLGMCLLPESPKWLLERKRLSEAREALSQIYGDVLDLMIAQCALGGGGEVEMASVATRAKSSSSDNPLVWGTHDQPTSTQEDEVGRSSGPEDAPEDVVQYCHLRDQAQKQEEAGALADLEDSPHDCWQGASKNTQDLWPWRYPLCIVLLLQAASQLGGGVVIRNYADALFQMNGANENMALNFTLSLAVIKLIFTLATICVLETAGRKVLFVLGAVIVSFGMLMLTTAAAASGNDFNIFVQAIALGLVVGGYGVGYGPVTWILSAEMFPVLLRGKVMALGLVSQNIFLLFTNLLFLVMLYGMPPAWTFAIFLVVNVLVAVLGTFFLRETKEKFPEQILVDLNLQYHKALHCDWIPTGDGEYTSVQRGTTP